MTYKIIDYEGETVKNGFTTSAEAWLWLHDNFTQSHIRIYNMRVIKEDKING